MATTIKLKNSVTTTNAPSSLVQGEVAINVTDKKVWVGNAATTPIQLLGGGADGNFTNISVSSVATFGAGTVSAPSITTSGDTNTGMFFPAADTVAASTGGTERMRILSDGKLLINKTSSTAGCRLEVLGVNGIDSETSTVTGTCFQGTYSNTTGTVYFGNWTYNGNNVGSITSTGSNTTYSTSSDYRLKENIASMTGALAKVAQLKPSTWTWKRNGSDGQGFIAHELAEVCPDAVVGEKDAVDEEGKPIYQGVDTSFLVATLTAAIQELKAEFDAYKATHP